MGWTSGVRDEPGTWGRSGPETIGSLAGAGIVAIPEQLPGFLATGQHKRIEPGTIGPIVRYGAID